MLRLAICVLLLAGLLPARADEPAPTPAPADQAPAPPGSTPPGSEPPSATPPSAAPPGPTSSAPTPPGGPPGAAPAPAAQSPAPPANQPPPVSHEHMQQDEAASILGRDVKGPKGEAIGKIVNVLVDADGQPRAAVIDFGGFLGVGMRKIAVAWRALHFTPMPNGKPQITLDMTPDQIKATPEYTASDKPVIVAAPPRPGIPEPQPAGPR